MALEPFSIFKVKGLWSIWSRFLYIFIPDTEADRSARSKWGVST